MKKENVLFVLILVLIGWNVWLSLPKKDNDSINYELFQELYKQSKRRMADFDKQVIKFNEQYEKDSIFVYSASRHERDSMRAELNSPY
jgi:predicted negative regulator of RcsB-dependent stress response